MIVKTLYRGHALAERRQALGHTLAGTLTFPDACISTVSHGLKFEQLRNLQMSKIHGETCAGDMHAVEIPVCKPRGREGRT